MIDYKTASDATHGWLNCFTNIEKEELLEELLGAITDSSSSGNWSQIQEVIEAWKETAEILSDEQLMSGIREAEGQFDRGEVIGWEKTKKKLSPG